MNLDKTGMSFAFQCWRKTTTLWVVQLVTDFGQIGSPRNKSTQSANVPEPGRVCINRDPHPKKGITSNVKISSLTNSKNSQTIFVYTQGLTGRYEEVKTMITRAIFLEVLTQMADCGFCQSGFGHVLIRLKPPTKCSRWQ